MEQPEVRVCENDSVFIRSLDTLLIHHAPGWCGQVPDAAFPCPVDVVRKREECITGARHIIQPGCVFLSFLRAQLFRDGLEKALPLCLLTTLKLFATDKEIDGIRFFWTLDTSFEWKG